jgi:molybdate transport system substrate-binding protein
MRELLVLAAASLRLAFPEIGAEFEKQRPEVTVLFSFAGSQTLATQVRGGVPADAIATADEETLAPLVRAKLVREPVVFAENRLVWLRRRDLPVEPAASVLGRPETRLVLAGPDVPVGRYARDALRRLDLLELAEERLVSRELDVRGVVAKVELGEADLGIAYATDVPKDGRALPEELPDAAQVRARYPVAVIAASKHPEDARAFAEFLRSAAAQKLLEQAGFRIP